MTLCHYLFTAVCGGIPKVAVNQKFVSQGITVHRFFFCGDKWLWCCMGVWLDMS